MSSQKPQWKIGLNGGAFVEPKFPTIENHPEKLRKLFVSRDDTVINWRDSNLDDQNIALNDLLSTDDIETFLTPEHQSGDINKPPFSSPVNIQRDCHKESKSKRVNLNYFFFYFLKMS